jgi:enoyl-CoA hydratase/carnithine racemase
MAVYGAHVRPFEEYSQCYRFVQMERGEDGILLMTLHDEGRSFHWSLEAQAEMVHAFREIGADRGNRLIIMTGTGEEFSGPRSSPDPHDSVYARSGITHTPTDLDKIHWNAKRLILNALDIEVPMIGVVNGPAKRHCELPLMCDIVLGATDCSFEDTAHFHLGLHVPGDGMSVLLTQLLGINRARYMMLTGQVIQAQQALDWGLVAELHSREKLLDRAWELARELASRPDLLLRYSRIVLTDPLRKVMEQSLQYHLSMETLATIDSHN